MATLSIIIPVYNEARTIEVLLDKVIEAPLDYTIGKQLVIVNDGSKDNTLEILNRYIENFKKRQKDLPIPTEIFLYDKQKNAGKGAAMI